MRIYTKHFTTIIFAFISLTYSLGQNVTITTQAEMDAFDSNTTMINGNFDINGFNSIDPITDLNNLSNLTSITGNLSIISNVALTNLDALSNLTSVAGYLDIRYNDVVINLDSLSNLTSVGDYLDIENNSSLTNLDGLSNLTSINGNLTISNNAVLTNINGLSNLTSIAGNLKISYAALTNIDGLFNLISIGGGMEISSNSSLINLDGLSGLTSINGNLLIAYNTALTNLDSLSSLTYSGGDLDIRNNNVLTNLDGLSNLISIGGYLIVKFNPVLTNLDGLFNLTSIGEFMSIQNNASLANLDGLFNLSSVDLLLWIKDNNVLTNLDGLSNLTSINGSLSIENNDILTDCCGIQNLLNTPGAISSNISIMNNPSECSSETQILNASCGLSIKIFNDLNQDCNNDNNEIGIANRNLIIQPEGIIGTTNGIGYWSIDSLPLGDYTVTIDTSGSWSSTCPVTQSFSVVEHLNERISFGLVSTQPCPAPNISAYMPFMRPCFENQKVYIQACNTYDGTGVLENAYVILELDSLLITTSSSIPYIELEDNIYQFDIGTLNPGGCSEFWIKTTLSCNAILGQSLCMEANLFPAADCVFDDIPNPFPSDISPCNTDWDMSSLTVKGSCQNDSIFFEIINSGSGDMTCFSPVRIYMNGDLIILDSIQLISGEIALFSFAADGQSWRLEADQHPLHPGNSQPNVLIEGCGGTVTSLPSLTNAMYLDDADPVVDIYCGEVTGSYDPNDKTGFPLGINASHDILPNQQIEYLIRFQNTGTDTAFTVVIRDTLSTNFDVFSVESGAASHSYDFEMYGPRVMQWTFNNILLPDSTANESGSHGFIKFTVHQIPDLPEGTVLENSAAIYFDFNEPIITNTSEHTISYFTPNFVTTNISEEACDSYTSPSGNNTWTNSGTYYDVIETENGDSVIIVDLAITDFSASITGIGGSTLVANIPNAEYQWLDCNDNLAPIVGATNQEFAAPETIGDYAVQITLGECQSISDCYYLNTIGIENHEFASSINIHPNPTSNFVFVDLGRNYQGASFRLTNILGQTIFEKTLNGTHEFQFEISGASGLYLLQIETQTGESAIFKVLKE